LDGKGARRLRDTPFRMAPDPTSPHPRGALSLDRARAIAFVEGYARTWESWDVDGFVDLFGEEIVYVAHPTEETVFGRDALRRYLLGERDTQGTVSVRLGEPMVEGRRVMAEFWVTATNDAGNETYAGCFIAQIDADDGRCTHFREYWFDIEGHAAPFDGWGE
jgi:ketosteroid isomerase-like protein